jgi:hypothetical protein
VTYGSAKFAAAVGTETVVKVKLNRKGRALLAHRRSAKVLAKVVFTAGGGKPASIPITLKR